MYVHRPLTSELFLSLRHFPSLQMPRRFMSSSPYSFPNSFCHIQSFPKRRGAGDLSSFQLSGMAQKTLSGQPTPLEALGFGTDRDTDACRLATAVRLKLKCPEAAACCCTTRALAASAAYKPAKTAQESWEAQCRPAALPSLPNLLPGRLKLPLITCGSTLEQPGAYTWPHLHFFSTSSSGTSDEHARLGEILNPYGPP